MNLVPHADRQRYTAIEVSREGGSNNAGGSAFFGSGKVLHLILEPGEGVVLRTSTAAIFDARFQPIIGYPPEKAAAHFYEFAKRLGTSEEAAETLSLILPHHKETIMATAKKKVVEDPKPVKRVAAPKKQPMKKAAAKVHESGWPFPPEKEVGKKPAAKAAKAPVAPRNKDKKPTASQLFQDLLMEGKLTDDQIFAKVKKDFGLDDKKRSYVGWYRQHLTKQGRNPPAAK